MNSLQLATLAVILCCLVSAASAQTEAAAEINAYIAGWSADIPGFKADEHTYNFTGFDIHAVETEVYEALIVVTDKAGNVLFKEIERFDADTDPPTYLQTTSGLLVVSSDRIIRGAGAAWQWVELLKFTHFRQNQVSTFTVPGKNENGGWGDPRAAWNIFVSQMPSVVLSSGNRIEVIYTLNVWEETSAYASKQDVEAAPANETRTERMIIELNVNDGFVVSDESTTNGILHPNLDLTYTGKYDDLPWQEMIQK